MNAIRKVYESIAIINQLIAKYLLPYFSRLNGLKRTTAATAVVLSKLKALIGAKTVFCPPKVRRATSSFSYGSSPGFKSRYPPYGVKFPTLRESSFNMTRGDEDIATRSLKF